MAEIPQSDFLKRFIGRRAELARLLRAWRLAKRGQAQFVLLLADHGFGKTRLIHEFYRRISRIENRSRGGYWPDELDPNPVTLCINPRITGRQSIADIPWLWWGLRWHNSSERNASDVTPCALLSSDAQRALRPHVLPLLKKRMRAQKAKGAAKAAVGLGMSLLSLLPGAAILGLISTVKDGYETLKAGKEWRDATGDHEIIDFEGAQSQAYGEADTAAMSFLNAFLDPSDMDAPTVPVILVLDDAQWADMVSLRFARQLFEHAWKRRLPLLVVATCWETEWKNRNAKLVSPPPRNADPENLNVVFSQLARTLGNEAGITLHKISVGGLSGVNGLEPILLAAFPGIKGEAREYLLATADGNPQQLVERINQLQAPSRRNWFQDESLQQNLTPRGLRELRALSTKHQDILDERIRRLEGDEPEVFTALKLGSLQGIRFYAEVVSAVSEQIRNHLSRGVSDALKRAEDPHNWVSNFPISFPAAEFKEFLGHKLFRECISKKESMRAIGALRTLLIGWFVSKRMEELDERAEICSVLARSLPANPRPNSETWTLRCAVITRCIDWLYAQWRRSEAAALAIEFCAWVDKVEASRVVAAIDLPACLTLPRALLDAHRYDMCVKFAAAALTRIPSPNISQRVALYKTIGKAERSKEDFPAAIRAFEAAITLTAGLPAKVRNQSGRLTRLHRELGSILSALERHDAAFRECKKALRTLQAMANEAQNSPMQVRVGAQILSQISHELYELGKLRLATRVQLRALELFTQCERLGDTSPSLLEQHSQALIQMGVYELYRIGGTPQQSVPFFERALRLRHRIVEKVGETPGALSDLASSYSRYASGLMTIGHYADARRAVDEALRLRREVLSRVGEQIEALRDFSLTLTNRADILRESVPPDLGLARSSLLEALHVRNSIIDRWGPRHYDLRLLHFVWRKQGEIEILCGDPNSALNMFSRARHTLRLMARVAEAEAEKKSLRSPDFLRLRHVCAEKLAEALERCSHPAKSRAALRFALLLNYHLQTDFEPSQNSREDGARMSGFAERIGIRAEQLERDRNRSFITSKNRHPKRIKLASVNIP